MSQLTLVRHAQASFFAERYDELSPIGQAQARLLGDYWLSGKRTFDEAYVGPRERQRHTAQLVAERYERAGISFPPLIELTELDEYDLDGILSRLAPALAQRNREFADVFEKRRSGIDDGERQRNFQKMFEPLMLHWLTEEAIEDLESWVAFRDRVQQGIQRIVNCPGKGRRVVAFSSGGFVGTAVQMVLGAPDRTALELNWRIPNTAVTEFIFAGQRISLDSFNSVAHLAEREMVTYR